MKKEGLLLPLNHEKIPNIKNLDKDYMNMSFDRIIVIQYHTFWYSWYFI